MQNVSKHILPNFFWLFCELVSSAHLLFIKSIILSDRKYNAAIEYNLFMHSTQLNWSWPLCGNMSRLEYVWNEQTDYILHVFYGYFENISPVSLNPPINSSVRWGTGLKNCLREDNAIQRIPKNVPHLTRTCPPFHLPQSIDLHKNAFLNVNFSASWVCAHNWCVWFLDFKPCPVMENMPTNVNYEHLKNNGHF